MSYTDRQKEHLILKELITEAISHGFYVRVHDGEEWAGPATRNIKRALEDTRSTDDDDIVFIVSDTNLDKVSEEVREFYHKSKAARPERKGFDFGTVSLGYGNGHDVIGNYSLSVEKYIEKTIKLAEALQDEDYVHQAETSKDSSPEI